MAAHASKPAMPAETSPGGDGPLSGLLQQPSRGVAVAPVAGQVLLGRLTQLPGPSTTGQAMVEGLGTVAVAHSLVALMPEHIGREIALSWITDAAALVLGFLWQGHQDNAHPMSHRDEGLVVTADGHREVIEAALELELRCGEACIVLTADGRIQLRGTYITSHASATQRIVGGSVHVN